MLRRTVTVLAVPLLLLLAACAPTPGDTASDTPTPTVSATTDGLGGGEGEPGEYTFKPADDYLIAGGLNEDVDGDGFWSAHYAFYTDDTESVRCDIWIFSGDAPGVLCAITPGNEALISYDLPDGIQCDLSTSNPYDGYSLVLGGKGLDSLAGWSGCAEQRDYSGDAVPVKVLGEKEQIIVEPFYCVVAGQAAGCGYTDDSGSIILGLNAAAHAG